MIAAISDAGRVGVAGGGGGGSSSSTTMRFVAPAPTPRALPTPMSASPTPRGRVRARIHIDRRLHLENSWRRQQDRERLLAATPTPGSVFEVSCGCVVCCCRMCAARVLCAALPFWGRTPTPNERANSPTNPDFQHTNTNTRNHPIRSKTSSTWRPYWTRPTAASSSSASTPPPAAPASSPSRASRRSAPTRSARARARCSRGTT